MDDHWRANDNLVVFGNIRRHLDAFRASKWAISVLRPVSGRGYHNADPNPNSYGHTDSNAGPNRNGHPNANTQSYGHTDPNGNTLSSD